MATDINLQAWLEKDATKHPPVVSPFIQSTQSGQVQYQVLILSKAGSTTSQISHGGRIVAAAGQATALPAFSLDVGPNDQCEIKLVLKADGEAAKNYTFDCPR